jgi:methionyl-tRNA formyltransferase
VPITATTTAAVLHDALAAIGARLVVRALGADFPPVPQPAEGASYAPKLTRADARIDWRADAVVIERRVRAFDPWPGTFTLLDGATLKVLAAMTVAGDGEPGVVLDDRLSVACGTGALRLTRVQLAGRAPLDAEVFLRGHQVPVGTRLG